MRWRRWLGASRGRVTRALETDVGDSNVTDLDAGPADVVDVEAVDAEDRYAAARRRMVRDQLLRRGLRDEEILRAFLAVPRHLFVDAADPYGDHALAIGGGQTISQPYVVAAMVRIARPREGYRDHSVLEIGTGSGYGAAILAELGARVVTIERQASLAAEAVERLTRGGYGTVPVVVGDGSLGYPQAAPYDAIIVTAAGPSVPQPLRDQLSPEGGRLVMPVGSLDQQWLTLVERRGADFRQREVEPVVFVPLLGEHGFPE